MKLKNRPGARDDLGSFISIDSVNTEVDSDGAYTSKVVATFEKRQCTFTMGMDKRMSEFTELTFSPEYSMGEIIASAASNLVVGMGTVFFVLIFIAWVISLFKYVNKFADSLGKKEEKKAAPAKAAAPAAAPAPAKAAAPAPAAASSDDEIQAVIAAAIAMYESEMGSGIEKQPAVANGITIRSIRRAGKR